jgi:hypothetical protein
LHFTFRWPFSSHLEGVGGGGGGGSDEGPLKTSSYRFKNIKDMYFAFQYIDACPQNCKLLQWKCEFLTSKLKVKSNKLNYFTSHLEDV